MIYILILRINKGKMPHNRKNQTIKFIERKKKFKYESNGKQRNKEVVLWKHQEYW